MPVYEYKCEKCGHVFEQIVLRKQEEEEIHCPKCTGEVKKLMSAPQEHITL